MTTLSSMAPNISAFMDKSKRWVEKNLGADCASFCRIATADPAVFEPHKEAILSYVMTGKEQGVQNTVALGAIDLCVLKAIDYWNRTAQALDAPSSARLKERVIEATQRANSQSIQALGGPVQAYMTYCQTADTNLELSDMGN